MEVFPSDQSDSCWSSSRSESGLEKASSMAARDAVGDADRELKNGTTYVDESTAAVSLTIPLEIASRGGSNRRASFESRLSDETVGKEPSSICTLRPFLSDVILFPFDLSIVVASEGVPAEVGAGGSAIPCGLVLPEASAKLSEADWLSAFRLRLFVYS